MSVMNLEKTLVSFCNTDVLQEALVKLAWGFSILFHFRFRKHWSMQGEERGVNYLSWFLWVCKLQSAGTIFRKLLFHERKY